MEGRESQGEINRWVDGERGRLGKGRGGGRGWEGRDAEREKKELKGKGFMSEDP